MEIYDINNNNKFFVLLSIPYLKIDKDNNIVTYPSVIYCIYIMEVLDREIDYLDIAYKSISDTHICITVVQ